MKKLIKRLDIKPPSKKFWAREFFIVVILSLISISVHFVNESRNSTITSKKEIINSEIIVIQNQMNGCSSVFFKHWILLKENYAFEGDYVSFLKEYGDYSKRHILKQLERNIGLEINKYWDENMYTKDYHLDKLYIGYESSYNIGYRGSTLYKKFNGFSKTKMPFSEFTEMIFSNDDFFKANYQEYILNNNRYFLSIEFLKKEITTDTHTFNIDQKKYFSLRSSLESKKSELNKFKESILIYDIEFYIFCFILFVYGLRLLISTIRWSIKQFAKKI